jgi:hypothetical protein
MKKIVLHIIRTGETFDQSGLGGSVQKDLNKWLKFYNEERTHQGYPNRGKRPIDTIKQFYKNVRKEA